MTLDPLLNSTAAIQLHAFTALGALALTGAIFAVPRGRRAHRILGWTWVIAMGVIAVSSFRIHTIGQFGPFSLIHGLSAVTLAGLAYGVYAARRRRVRDHRRTMLQLVWFALIGAGAFTLLPGRVMHAVLTGG
ncbi:DUF2306 domain-containing protein [Roseovarius salinarum]|uniref:DUF2306 domain-containing protein n=1 Tax=Roseovarius salinarum TaxID=1981892 RepID=UPI000C341380|nr:DUF2306 domain-containing protein [Roseovarius salinarum]